MDSGGGMNGPLQRLRRLIARASSEVSISQAAFRKYNECVDEWNNNLHDDSWWDSARARECEAFIEWFDEVHE